MDNNRRSVTLKPMIEWADIIDSAKPELYPPVSRVVSHLEDITRRAPMRSTDPVCGVSDIDTGVKESPTISDNDAESEEDWSGAERHYSTSEGWESTNAEFGAANLLHTLPSPWIVHVPRMEREINNIVLGLGRAPTDYELAEWMGLRGIIGLAHLFFLLEDIGGTLCTQRQNGCCPPDVPQSHSWMLRSLRFRALRAELQNILRDALSGVSTEDKLHVSVYYKEESSRESATLEVFHGHPNEGDILFDIEVFADDRVCLEQEPESVKRFQIKTWASQNGALGRGALWERFHDNLRLRRNTISWYWFRSNQLPVRWQREMHYHITIV